MISKTIKNEIKAIMKQLPKMGWDDPDYFTTYELMIYTKKENNDWDLDDFSHFKDLRDLDKVIKRIINNYGERLNHIDFKWSEEEGDFDQMTIYTKV
jgi:hypothetical protein